MENNIPSLDEMKKINKEKKLGLIIRKTSTPEDIWQKIQEKISEGNGDTISVSTPEAPKKNEGKAYLSVAEYQTVIDKEKLNLRITPIMRKNPESIERLIAERRKDKKEK